MLVMGCHTVPSAEENVYRGEIEPAGFTTYQYGSHILIVNAGNPVEFYALTSDTIDLTEYEFKRVKLIGLPVEGYPVDGGPTYLKVTEIEVRTP